MKTLIEILWVAAVGLAVAVGANALNPAGLAIERDYFPKAAVPSTTEKSTPGATAREPATADPASVDERGSEVSETPTDDAPVTAKPAVDSAEQAMLDKVSAKGFSVLSFAETRAIFEDELYEFEAYMFIDARNADHYAEGHIPGAHQFDHYYAHQHVDTLLPLIQTSMKVVVYCTGGNCEDSEFATTVLTQFGVDPSLLHIYVGGIEDWKARAMPVERGERHSGDIVPGDEL